MTESVTAQDMSVPVVTIKNWADFPKPPLIKNTTVKTWVIDPAGAAGPAQVQIASEEPKRLRMVVIPIDQAVAITKEKPITSPDTNTVSTAPEGGYLPPAARPYEFFGTDAWYLNAVGTVGRVTVIKEYS